MVIAKKPMVPLELLYKDKQIDRHIPIMPTRQLLYALCGNVNPRKESMNKHDIPKLISEVILFMCLFFLLLWF